jgi:hypothetical protein
MTKNSPTLNVFDFWINLNNKLWNSWATCYSFPLKTTVLNSVFFQPIATWNAFVDQYLHFQFAAVLPSAERLILRPTVLNEPSADAILEDIFQSTENSLPEHTEFDTLIYPWHEAERTLPVHEHRPIYPDVSNVA